jgi:adenylate kinase
MMARGFAVLVAGVPGTGKTTTAIAVAARRPETRHVTGSSVLRVVISPATLADFDGWTPEQRDAARDLAIARLVVDRASQAGILLVDGHFSLRDRRTHELHSVFTEADARFYDALVLLDPATQSIVDWRRADVRQRPPEDPSMINAHLEYERNEAIRLARNLQIPFLQIESTSLDARVSMISAFLDALA